MLFTVMKRLVSSPADNGHVRVADQDVFDRANEVSGIKQFCITVSC
jgi:hypothetical protein